MKLGTKLENAIREAWDRGYRVTDSGELISPHTGKRLRLAISNTKRYPTFSLTKVKHLAPSGVFGIPVHCFAAFCFYGDLVWECDAVRHLDGDTLNISKTNIVLGSDSDNEYDKSPEIRSRTAKTARACRTLESNRELLEADVVILRRHYWAIRGDAKKLPNGAMRYLCDTYQLTRTAINKIVRRITYAEIA